MKFILTIVALFTCASLIALTGDFILGPDYNMRFWEQAKLSTELALRRGNHSRALESAMEEISYGQKLGSNSFWYGVSLADAASIYRIQNDSESALSMASRALGPLIDENKKRPSDIVVTETLGRNYLELAAAQEALEQDQLAADAYRRCIGTIQQSVDRNTRDPTTSQLLIVALLRSSRLEEKMGAKKAAQENVKLAQSLMARGDCPSVLLAEVRREFASALDLPKANVLTESASKREAWAKYSRAAAQAMINSDLSGAATAFYAATAIAESMPADKLLLATSYRQMAHIELERNNFASAAKYSNLAVDLLVKANYQTSAEMEKAVTMQFRALHALKLDEQARRVASEGLQTSITKFGATSPKACFWRVRLALVTQDRPERLRLIGEAIAVSKKRKAVNKKLVQFWQELGDVCEEIGEFDLAIEAYKICIEAELQEYGARAFRHNRLNFSIASAQQFSGKPREATCTLQIASSGLADLPEAVSRKTIREIKRLSQKHRQRGDLKFAQRLDRLTPAVPP